jgi:hypothetical protein
MNYDPRCQQLAPDVACIAGKLPAFKCTPGLKSMCFGVDAN